MNSAVATAAGQEEQDKSSLVKPPGPSPPPKTIDGTIAGQASRAAQWDGPPAAVGPGLNNNAAHVISRQRNTQIRMEDCNLGLWVGVGKRAYISRTWTEGRGVLNATLNAQPQRGVAGTCKAPLQLQQATASQPCSSCHATAAGFKDRWHVGVSQLSRRRQRERLQALVIGLVDGADSVKNQGRRRGKKN